MVFSLSENFGFKRVGAAQAAPVAPKVSAYSTLEKTGIAAITKRNFVAYSVHEEDWGKYDTKYYLKGAAAGGICCGITHGALTPVDVVRHLETQTIVALDCGDVCLAPSSAPFVGIRSWRVRKGGLDAVGVRYW